MRRSSEPPPRTAFGRSQRMSKPVADLAHEAAPLASSYCGAATTRLFIGAQSVTKYIITEMHLSSPGALDISKEMYLEIKRAQFFWFHSISIEEKYDALVENYFEFERELLNISSRYMLFSVSNIEFWNYVGLINRRLLNFLAASTMYTEHARRHIIHLYGKKSTIYAAYEQAGRNRKSSQKGFEALDAIRNYAQHAGYATDDFSIGAAWKEVDERQLNIYDINVYLSKSSLSEEARGKEGLSTIYGGKAKVDLQEVVREAMEGLCCLNEDIRELLESEACNSRNITESCLSVYGDKFSVSKDFTSLAVCAVEDNGIETEHKYILRIQMQRRDAFIKKNGSLTKLSSCRVMS